MLTEKFQKTVETVENVSEQGFEHGDVALKVARSPNSSPVSAKEQRLVLRKIDFRLLPLLILTFMLQYADKVILTGASQFGIVEDLHLYEVKGFDPTTRAPILDLHRYANATLMFYWGCLAGLIPASFLAQRLPVAKFLGCTIIIWGVVVMLTVVVTGYRGLLIQRFFLGFTECAVAPGSSIIIAMWWKKNEQPLRFCLWYTSTGLGGLFGSLLLYGIGHIQGHLRPWKYQYLILGAITIAWGIIVVIFLADNPTTARFLTAEEKTIAVERMRSEQTGIETKKFKFVQVKETLVDPKTWILIALTFCLTFVNGAVSGFGAIIVRSFGYSALKSVLLLGSVGACVFVTLLLVGLTGTLVSNTRIYLLAACELPVIIGAALVWKIDWVHQRGGAIAGFIMLGTFAAAYVMVLALAGANTAGHTKKVFTSGLLWTSWAVSNGVAPLTVKTVEVEDHYPTCFKTAIATAAATVVLAFVLRAYLQWQNHVRNRDYGKPQTSDTFAVGFQDQTDMENKLFRYVL